MMESNQEQSQQFSITALRNELEKNKHIIEEQKKIIQSQRYKLKKINLAFSCIEKGINIIGEEIKNLQINQQ